MIVAIHSDRGWNSWTASDKADCIVTNPPFGGLEDDNVGSDYLIKTRETADMFMSLIVKKLLRDKGRAAVVLPDGFLFGEGTKSLIKQDLLNECNLHTIVRLPSGVFSPYTSIKTNLLFFTKGQPTETIWFYEHRYPEGQKSYSKTRPLRIEEFDTLKSWWGNESDGFKDRVETEQAWTHPFRTLKVKAEAKGQPHRDKAEQLKNEADALNDRLVEMRAGLKKESNATTKRRLQKELNEAQARYDSLLQKVKEEYGAWDRHIWPIYNLDIKNPTSPDAEVHNPEKLLAKYKRLMSEIGATETKLRDELATALSHRSEGGKAE